VDPFLKRINCKLFPDSELDLGAKMGPERLKNQSAQNLFKTNVCVGLIDVNQTQLERDQTNVVCERYNLAKEAKFVDCTIRTVLTWQLTVQDVRPYR
jgi:hypothetical protein